MIILSRVITHVVLDTWPSRGCPSHFERTHSLRGVLYSYKNGGYTFFMELEAVTHGHKLYIFVMPGKVWDFFDLPTVWGTDNHVSWPYQWHYPNGKFPPFTTGLFEMFLTEKYVRLQQKLILCEKSETMLSANIHQAKQQLFAKTISPSKTFKEVRFHKIDLNPIF